MTNSRPRIGMLGAGFISDYHLSGLQQAGAEIVSLYSRTEAIVAAGALLDIGVLDHIIIGRNRYVSLKERKLGFRGKGE